jgi:hypothetical protein
VCHSNNTKLAVGCATCDTPSLRVRPHRKNLGTLWRASANNKKDKATPL